MEDDDRADVRVRESRRDWNTSVLVASGGSAVAAFDARARRREEKRELEVVILESDDVIPKLWVE